MRIWRAMCGMTSWQAGIPSSWDATIQPRREDRERFRGIKSWPPNAEWEVCAVLQLPCTHADVLDSQELPSASGAQAAYASEADLAVLAWQEVNIASRSRLTKDSRSSTADNNRARGHRGRGENVSSSGRRALETSRHPPRHAHTTDALCGGTRSPSSKLSYGNRPAKRRRP
jgi:hypothetical protein